MSIYAFHISEYTIDAMCLIIRSNKVSFFLFFTTKNKHFLVPLSIAPNTQIRLIFNCRPLLCFIFVNKDSSISTILPGPPITAFSLSTADAQQRLINRFTLKNKKTQSSYKLTEVF